MWLYRDKEVHCHNDLSPECTNFVYIIEYTNGQVYYGKKTVRSIRKRPPLKGKKRNRRINVDLPFKNYEGSSEHTEGLIIKSKEILYQCSTKKAATYLEMAIMVHHDALFDDMCLNKNIAGKHFDNDLKGLL